VVFDSPNALLLSQLGLVNPASLAWELVPFSFVVDWFANVGDFLASFTDTVGCTLSNTAVTTTRENGQMTQFNGYYGTTWKASYKSMNRVIYLGSPPGPTLKLRPFKGLSISRGLTSVSLLLQNLKVGSVRKF